MTNTDILLEDLEDVLDDATSMPMTKKSLVDVEKIKTFHDYIINNTVYDQKRANEIESNTQGENTLMSHKANGVLTNHVALCSGYTDLMAIFAVEDAELAARLDAKRAADSAKVLEKDAALQAELKN